ncbi:hypothetical protein CDL12_02043 [Handroanthus impetiginosus]|uniref:SWIM-type domain-containing protein n=1 Tax=Handroanthus impetiginosus TaxID=429701 RepID=A0A2G9I629_9LAMI|nr:hypothetical protein CDL12_02043 [Handroanthus impetiginosus]
MDEDKKEGQCYGNSVDDKSDRGLDAKGRVSLESNFLQLNPEEVGELVFHSPDEADWFYWNYGRQNGFDVRRCHKKTVNGSLVKNVEWVCSRAGFRQPLKYEARRKRRPREETRCGCEARFRVAHDRHDGLYKVTEFVPFHNHALETPETAHRLRCYRHLKPSEKNLLSGMTSAGISPSKAIDYLQHIEGGAEKVAFRRKDVYNYLNKQRMLMTRDGDVNTALSLLDGMKLHDKDMIFEYTVDEEHALTRLFWTDGLSRAEFDLFGDVVVFDSTYKTNTYCFPLVIIAGVDNHYSTCVFGAALLYNETIESYQWLLQKFREAMGGKMPMSVLTDQDAAMHAAIEIEFPFAKHRICSWHLERNAMQNTHIPEFARDFAQLLKKTYSIEEFESSWLTLIERHGVADHPWIIDIFKKKELCGEAYFRGHFFGMMRTTQRSESMNYLMKQCLKQRMKLTEFLKQYHLCIQKMRATFFWNQEDSERSTPALLIDALNSLEKHAAFVYTKKVFEMVSKEIRKEQDLVVEEASNHDGNKFTFQFSSYAKAHGKPVTVQIDWVAQKFQCDCEKLESTGLPCRHLISAFKLLRLQEFPQQCIKERWTVKIGKELRVNFPTPFPFEDEQRRRFAILNRECASLCLQASQSEQATFKSLMRIQDLVQEVEYENTTKSPSKDSVQLGKVKLPTAWDPKRTRLSHDVHNPKKIRSRGAPKAKQQNCRKCGRAIKQILVDAVQESLPVIMMVVRM